MIPLAVLVQVASSPGQTFAIMGFTPHFQASLGLSSSQLALAYMLGTCLAAIPLSAIGPLSDRFGIRATVLTVASTLALACCIMSVAQGFFSLLFGFLLLRFLGQGSMTLLGSNMISMWFRSRLGTVNAVMSLGGAAAFALVPMILLDAIDHFGWRSTYLLMGATVLVLIVPIVWLLAGERPEDLGQFADGKRESEDEQNGTYEPCLTLGEALRHRTLWILSLSMASWAGVGTGIIFYALEIFGDLGIPADSAKLLFGTFSSSMLATQVLGGVLADRFQLRGLLSLGFVMLTLGAAAVPMTQNTGTMHLFALLFGGGQGFAISITATMWARYYGRNHLGKIRGIAWCLTVAGSGCGPLFLGIIKDWTGSFQLGLWLFTAIMLPLPLILLFATPPERINSADADIQAA